MKKIIIIAFLAVVFFNPDSKAQVSLNFESGNRSIEEGNCWNFSKVTYSNIEFRINGFWSGRTVQLANPTDFTNWIKTPWMNPGQGNITMKGRLENSSGVYRNIVFSYVAYDANAVNNEGVSTTFYTYTFPKPHTIDIRNISVEIPAAIRNASLPYKINIAFVGSGANGRIFSDDIVIPGTYAANPVNSCMPVILIQDADNDGVADTEDAYPADPYKAYNNYFPSQQSSGTLAFEDQWPGKGDYDFNDLVVDYRLNTVTNAQNNVVEVLGNFTLKASGASFRNGFGFQLDGIAPAKVISVTGNALDQASIYSVEPNGLESGQSFANCIVFENFYKVMPWPGSGIGINTDPGAPSVAAETLNIKITFIENGTPATGGTVAFSALTTDKFNFYLVSNLHRGHEIHLADHMPTDLVDASLFGTQSDNSNPSQGRYYKTENNLPWGINVIQGFEHTIEKAPINEAYLHFIEWAATNGASFSDWYLDLSGYRNDSKIR